MALALSFRLGETLTVWAGNQTTATCLDVLSYSYVRRKLTQKLQETEEALSSASQKASNAEKAKNRLNSELEDALIDLEKVSLFQAEILSSFSNTTPFYMLLSCIIWSGLLYFYEGQVGVFL